MTETKAALRVSLRNRRRALSPAAAAEGARAVRDRLADLGWLEVEHVAVYRAFDGELDAEPIAAHARAAGATTWYPVVEGDGMRFVAWDGESPLTAGAFGIEEPTAGDSSIDPAALDLVVVPLVGFDVMGRRLGMGRGYYDRSFAFVTETTDSRPRLVAVAFDMQEVDVIDADRWDVPLDAVVTPTRLIGPLR